MNELKQNGFLFDSIKCNEDRITLSARELHEFLEIKTEFAKWMHRMCEYGFSKDVDYRVIVKNDENPLGGRPSTDYEITIDMAKEIAMIQRNEKGKQARQYFLNLEKAWNDPKMVLSRALKVANSQLTEFNNLIKKQQNAIDEQDKIIKEKNEYIETYLGNITLADKRQTLVEVIESAKNNSISQRWNMLYKEFGRKYHMNIFLRTENYRKRTGNKKFRYLDYIEKELNMLSELYDLALALYHSDANKLIEKKYYLNNATKNKLSLSNLN